MITKKKALSLVFVTSLAAVAAYGQNTNDWGSKQIRHVLLISIDGLYAADYLNCSKGVPASMTARPIARL